MKLAEVIGVAPLVLAAVKFVLTDKLLDCKVRLLCNVLEVLYNKLVEKDEKFGTVGTLEIGVEVTVVAIKEDNPCSLDAESLEEAE